MSNSSYKAFPTKEEAEAWLGKDVPVVAPSQKGAASITATAPARNRSPCCLDFCCSCPVLPLFHAGAVAPPPKGLRFYAVCHPKQAAGVYTDWESVKAVTLGVSGRVSVYRREVTHHLRGVHLSYGITSTLLYCSPKHASSR